MSASHDKAELSARLPRTQPDRVNILLVDDQPARLLSYETILGDYKDVNGWYLPFSVENGVKGNPNRQKTTYSKIEANVPMASALFVDHGIGEAALTICGVALVAAAHLRNVRSGLHHRA